MNAYASIIIFDRADIRLSVAVTEEAIRYDLVEFFNDQADDDPDLDLLEDDATLDETVEAIREELGHAVLIEQTYVFGDPVA